jgi:hypothetical protein
VLDWIRFEGILKLSSNKIAEVLIEYSCEYPPRQAVVIDLTKGSKNKKELVIKRPFEEQASDLFAALPSTPSSSSNKTKKPKVTSTSLLLDSHHSQVQAQASTVFDYARRIHNKWTCQVLKCNENRPYSSFKAI